jgi:hypothetical protein
VRGAFVGETGMLVVDNVIRGGPASDVLKPGDVLLRVNGTLCTHFIPLEEILDNTIAIKQALTGEPSEVSIGTGVANKPLDPASSVPAVETGGAGAGTGAVEPSASPGLSPLSIPVVIEEPSLAGDVTSPR